jgi:hypothetical protein
MTLPTVISRVSDDLAPGQTDPQLVHFRSGTTRPTLSQPITFAVRWNGSTVTDTIPPQATTTFDWR